MSANPAFRGKRPVSIERAPHTLRSFDYRYTCRSVRTYAEQHAYAAGLGYVRVRIPWCGQGNGQPRGGARPRMPLLATVHLNVYTERRVYTATGGVGRWRGGG